MTDDWYLELPHDDHDGQWHHVIIRPTPDGTVTYLDGRRLSPDEARAMEVRDEVGDVPGVSSGVDAAQGWDAHEARPVAVLQPLRDLPGQGPGTPEDR